MDYRQLIDSLSPDIVARFRSAVETGRWPDGRPLSEAQKAHCVDALIAWDERHLPEEQRIGFIDTSGLRARHSQEKTPSTDTLRWVANDPEEAQTTARGTESSPRDQSTATATDTDASIDTNIDTNTDNTIDDKEEGL